jgi:hypothetical protein
VIVVHPYPGAPEIRVPVPSAPPEVVCWICGRPWIDAFLIESKSVCGPCYAAYPYNLYPDWCPPGMEQSGSGI